jgi:LSD1 subclass zinc finger protein
VPIVSCPKCPTKLRIPDGATGNVKCPKCNTIFPAAATPEPAFEVIDEAPAKPAAPARPAASPPPPAKADFEFDDDPKPKKKRVVARVEVDEDEDDRPRSKRRRDDEDDEDDRPRRGRSRGRRRDYDDEDDDYDNYRSSGKQGGFGPAKTGTMLLSISLWMYFGTFALLAFFLLLAWVGVSIPNGLMIVIGLLGLGNWIVGLIGLGFCIAGPAKARGLAIAATVVASVHLIMAFVVANNTKAGIFGEHTIESLSAMNKFERLMNLQKKIQNETDPKRQKELMEEGRALMGDDREEFKDALEGKGSRSSMRWADLATMLPMSDQLIAVLSYQSKLFEEYLLPLFGGLLELARLILIILLLGAIARSAKAHDAAERSITSTVVVGGTVLAATIVVLILAVIVDSYSSSKVTSMEAAQSLGRKLMNWGAIGALLVYVLHLVGLLIPPFMAGMTSSGCSRRSR